MGNSWWTQILHHFHIDIGADYVLPVLVARHMSAALCNDYLRSNGSCAVCCSGRFEAILFGFRGDGEVRVFGAQSFQFWIDIAPAKLVAAVFLEIV